MSLVARHSQNRCHRSPIACLDSAVAGTPAEGLPGPFPTHLVEFRQKFFLSVKLRHLFGLMALRDAQPIKKLSTAPAVPEWHSQ